MNVKKLYKVPAVIIALLAIYAVLGFFLLPALALRKLPELIAQHTGQQAQVQALHFNPFSLSVEIEGFKFTTAEGSDLLAFDGLSINLAGLASLQQRGVVLDSLVLRKPLINIERRTDASFNFSPLLSKQPETAEPPTDEQPLPILIHQISLEEGQLAWVDLWVGPQAKETLTPINLNINQLTTLAEGQSLFDLQLQFASGGKIDLKGEMNLAMLKSSGQLIVEQLLLPKVWELFLQSHLPLVIADGRLSLRTEYAVSQSEQGFNVSLNQGGLEIKQLDLQEKSRPDSLISIPDLAVRGVALDLNKQQLKVAAVTSSDATIKSWLQADGQLNYQALFAEKPEDATPSPTPANSAAQPWQIKIDELALANYQIQFTDRSQAKPVEMVLTALNCKVQKFNTASEDKLPVDFSTRINKNAELKLNGTLGLSPLTTDWTVALNDLKLSTFQTYIDPYLNLDLVDGYFNTQGHLQLAMQDDVQLTFQGETHIDGLITRDKLKNKDFVKWSNLELQQLSIDVAKQDYKLGKVIFEQPYVRFFIKKDGSTNIDDILVAQHGETQAPAKPQSPAKIPASKAKAIKTEPKPAQSVAQKTNEPTISIDKVVVKGGKSDFADYSLLLPFVAQMNKLEGEVNGFSSQKDAVAKLQLQGKVYDLAQVNIKGQYQLQNGDSDIALSFKHMPLPLVTPYMAEFAGYKIEKGQMALDLQYNIKQGQLTANNKIFIDQLTLGEHIDNPKAVSLPLHLAVALLKDGEGKINLDFPITGSLDDPQFSVGSLIGDVLVNMVTKVVSSPFKAFASLFGDEEDLSAISFAYGIGDLAPDAISKLELVGKALASKPELVLEVKGVAYQLQDWPVLRTDAVKDILKKMKSGELRDKGEKIRSEYIELSDAEYKRLLAKFYAEVFPSEIDFTLLGNPRMKHNHDVDFYDTARQQLEAIMPPEPERLNALAVTRANHITQYLIEQAGIHISRIYILSSEIKAGEVGADADSLLSLNVAQ